jgi:hypothetical protein
MPTNASASLSGQPMVAAALRLVYCRLAVPPRAGSPAP